LPRLQSRISKLLLAGLVCLALAATHPYWLRALGSALVREDTPVHSDLVVVLAGDYYGHRVLHGAELVRKGYAPKALVSGPDGFYGVPESDLAIAFAVRRGYPEELFVPAPHHAQSTREEAEFLAGELRRMGVRRYLLVTSNYHTARAARIFRSRIPDIEMRVVSAPDQHYFPDLWWMSRNGRKLFVLEWQKSLAGLFGM
jgi:uncharacterized SAM-binding protein YcdF (DUF218 family)